jgi:serine/threonine protein kinase/TolB-like protein
MTPEEWELTKQILDVALGLPEVERVPYILKATENSPSVRASVLEILPHYTNDPSNATIRPAHVLAPGQLVARRFRVVRLIAAGGMGEVYEAYDEWLRLRLALKTLRYGQTADGDTLERFKRELLLARGVAHENLCRVFDFVEHRAPGPAGDELATPCFTMELLEGETLADLLNRSRPLPLDAVLDIVRQVVSGLQILHERGITHRDLKPSNIMIVPRQKGPPRAVVMDFGLAKPETCQSEIFESAPDFEGAGAPFFMAPEVIRRQRPTFASDIYALGLVIDEMVTTSRAFQSKSMAGLFYEKLQEQPVMPSKRSTDLPLHWEQTILRCIDNEPGARFSSVSAVLQALEHPESADELIPVTKPPVVEIATRPGYKSWRSLPRWAWITLMIWLPAMLWMAGWTVSAVQPINTSVQVFEIENLTQATEYNYVAKGTTDQLMSRLLKVPGVRIFAVHSTRAVTPDVKAGRFSLDGTLQAHAGQIRLAMQLFDNERSGDLLWSETFDSEDIKNPLGLQTQIAEKAVQALERRLVLGPNSANGFLANASYQVRRLLAFESPASWTPTTNNAAFDLYMRGHNLLEEVSPAAAAKAIEYFRRAIEADPNFALAYAAAADAYMQMMNYNYRPHEELAAQAREYANKAVQRDPRLAEAHSVLAAVRQHDWDWKGAEESYREALRLKPNFSRARRWYAGLLAQFGRWSEALSEAQNALEQDPFDRSGPPAVGCYLFLAGRYDESIRMLTSAIAEKDMPMTRANLGEVYAWLAHTITGAKSDEYFQLALEQAQAIERAERVSSPDGRTPFADKLFALAYAAKGNEASLQPYLERMEQDMLKEGTSPVSLASVYAMRGQVDKACDLLDRAVVKRDRRLLYAKVVPFLTKLHGLPRFTAVLRQMNMG